MIKEFENLDPEERQLLYKAPVLVSVLASCTYNDINQKRKKDAIRLAHIRTFTAPFELFPYYREVEKIFEEEFENAVKEYFPFDESKRAALQSEINKFNNVIAKLDSGYAYALNKSLESYAQHVKRSDHSVFRDFIFPITLSKLKDA